MLKKKIKFSLCVVSVTQHSASLQQERPGERKGKRATAMHV